MTEKRMGSREAGNPGFVPDEDIVPFDFGEEIEGSQTPDWRASPVHKVQGWPILGDRTPDWFLPPGIPPSDLSTGVEASSGRDEQAIKLKAGVPTSSELKERVTVTSDIPNDQGRTPADCGYAPAREEIRPAFEEENEGFQTPDWQSLPEIDVTRCGVHADHTFPWSASPGMLPSWQTNDPPNLDTSVPAMESEQRRYEQTSKRFFARRRMRSRHIQPLMYPLPNQSQLANLEVYNTYHHHHVHEMKFGAFDESGLKSTCTDPSHHMHVSQHKIVLVEMRLYTLHPTSSLPEFFKQNRVRIQVTSREPATYSTVIVKQKSLEFVHHIVHEHNIYVDYPNHTDHFTIPSTCTQTCSRTITQCRLFSTVGDFLHYHFHEHIHSILIRPANFSGAPSEVGKFMFLNVTRFNLLAGTSTQLGGVVYKPDNSPTVRGGPTFHTRDSDQAFEDLIEQMLSNE